MWGGGRGEGATLVLSPVSHSVCGFVFLELKPECKWDSLIYACLSLAVAILNISVPHLSPSIPSHLLPLPQVRSIVWNSEDTHLVSCSTDGAVYEWNMQAYRREKDCVVKNCSYSSVAVTADLKVTFAVGSDCTLKEINLADAAVSWGNGRLGLLCCTSHVMPVHTHIHLSELF